MLAIISSHFDTVREAMQMSPSTSLCIAALCAATCATPPAPMIRTFFFMLESPLQAPLRPRPDALGSSYPYDTLRLKSR